MIVFAFLYLKFSMLLDHMLHRITPRTAASAHKTLLEFMFDFFVVRCVPMLLVQTLLSQWLPQFYALFAVVLLIAYLYVKRRDGFVFRFLSEEKVHELTRNARKRFISEYRTGVTLATCMCISVGEDAVC